MAPPQQNIFTILLLLIGLAGCQSNALKDRDGRNIIKDIDGNSYRTVKIGTQVWMTEDLIATRYNDGTTIPLVTSYDDWAALTTPAYCWYNNDSTFKETYGALYNWYAVNTDKICPEGWHVPTDEEWNILMSHVGDMGTAGGALKETGMDHWKNPNSGATNESGFSGLPGGYRSYNGTFNLLRADGFWWSTTESNWWGSSSGGAPITVLYRNLRYDTRDLFRSVSEKSTGFCIRCLKDE